MAYKQSTDAFEVVKSLFLYPWLEYQGRTKELKDTTAPVQLPLSCHQVPKEEFPPSPERWREHPSKPNSVPYCYSKEPEIYTHWHNLYDKRKEPQAQILLKRGDHPKYLKDSAHNQKFHLTMSKLSANSKVGSGPSEPTRDPLKWQRLKELTESLKSPREDDQLYAIQALGNLGINDKFVMKALWQAAQTGPKEVTSQAYRTLAILGCLNKHVIQTLIKQLVGKNENERMETLTGLRVALNSWAAVPEDKRTQVGKEEELILALQMLMKKSMGEAALEAVLCLGFLRPCSNMAQEFLLQCLGQKPKAWQMKALRMLVKIMHVHSAAVIRAILAQLGSSHVLEDRFEATEMLRTIGLEQIQAQGLEKLTFDLLKRKTYNEPFFALRQAVAATVEELGMKPTMVHMMEEQLVSPDAIARQQAVTSLGVLGISGPQVFHLFLDMLDVEENKAVKKSLQEALILWASIDPWIQKKLKNKVFSVNEAPKTNVKAQSTRFRKKPENLEELNIQDFRLVKLNPLSIAKASTKVDKKFPDFPPSLSNHKNKSQRPQGPGSQGPDNSYRALMKSPKRSALWAYLPSPNPSLPEYSPQASYLSFRNK
ncbi:protein HEATR9 [Ctenodactylus gundi]